MRVRVLLFAGLRERVGEKERVVELPDGLRVRDLLARLERELPPVERYRGRLMISVNERRATLEMGLKEGDEVALLPPISGGSAADAAVSVRSGPLSMDVLLAQVQDPACGGVVTFSGVVRNLSRDQRIDHLEYEAYVPMAEKELRVIIAEAQRRWPQVRLALAHRVGRLEIGDAAVMIAAAAPHRADAFEACRFAIDTLKRTAPIWKKEFAEGGAYWVEENP